MSISTHPLPPPPPQKKILYLWVERGTVRVTCPAQKLTTMSRARAQTQTARSGDKCINYEAITTPMRMYAKAQIQ